MNRTLFTLRAALILLTLLLTACGSSPPVRYFSLETADAPLPKTSASSTVVAFGPLRIPEYLDRKQMVTRGAGAEITVHEYSRWAEPMDESIHRIVASRLDNQLENVVVVAYPYLRAYHMEYRILGQVDRFDSDLAGQVVLQVQWSAIAEDTKPLIAPRRARYETRAANPGDPGDIAAAMSRALSEFSDDVARQLGDALAKTEANPDSNP